MSGISWERRLSLAGLGGAAALMALIPWMEAAGHAAMGLWLDLLAHLAALALVALAVVTGGGVARRILAYWLPAGFLLLVSGAGAAYGFAAALRLFEMTTAFALALALAALFGRGESGRHREVLAWLLVAAAVPAALAAQVGLLAGWGRGTAGFVNPNHLAAFLVAVLPLSLVVARRASLLGWLAGAVLTGGVLATRSRGALLAVGLVMGIALAVAVTRRRLRGATLYLGLAVVVLFSGLAGSALWTRFADGTDIYRYDRLLIWPQVVRMARDAPLLGIGPGQFPYRAGAYNFPRDGEVVRYGRAFQAPHSYPLLLLAEGGGLVFLALSLAVVLTIRRALQDWRQVEFILSLFDEPLARPPVLLAAALLAGLALPPAPLARSRGMAKRAAILAVLVAAAVALVIQPTRAQSLALRAAATSNPERQVVLLAAARRVLPGQVHYSLETAKLLLAHAARPLDLKSYARIRVAVDRAVVLDPAHADGHLVRARLERRACLELLRTEASCARAAADYRLAARGAPTDARLLREEASFAQLRGRLAEAATRLRQAVALEPVFVGAWHDLLAVERAAAAPPARLVELTAHLDEARRRARGVVPDSVYARDILQATAEPPSDAARGGGV
ncbi:MAG: O-antigen ligase family protein [Acidobacteria bacterium]|nr:O-antigen ligase family protein [Acidobacteriota bacterium]